MIEVNHITKRFGKVTAVDDFTLDINRGSVLGIVGSNGGGKSTLLRILSGVFDADSGEVKINGQNIYNNPSVKGECFFIPDFPYFSNRFLASCSSPCSSIISTRLSVLLYKNCLSSPFKCPRPSQITLY